MLPFFRLNDEQESDPSTMITGAGPSRKKLKLTVLGLAQRENFDPSMSTANKEATKQLRNWGNMKNSKELLNSDPPVSTSLVSN